MASLSDVAVLVGALGGAAATVLGAVSAWRSARSKDRLDQITAVATKLEALQADTARAAREAGQHRYQLTDRLNTLDERTQAVQRRVERIPGDSVWNYVRGQLDQLTPPSGTRTGPSDEPITQKHLPSVAPRVRPVLDQDQDQDEGQTQHEHRDHHARRK